jgi:hypothetical protein
MTKIDGIEMRDDLTFHCECGATLYVEHDVRDNTTIYCWNCGNHARIDQLEADYSDCD